MNNDPCDAYFNIYLDPLFSSNFNLLSNSPCIDAGNPSSAYNPDNTIADMGAYYYSQSTGIGDEYANQLPDGFELYPAYPNPFNPSTAISYKLQAASFVNVAVYDITGREIASLVDGFRAAGAHKVVFDGSELSSGVYFAVLRTPIGVQTEKLLLLK